MKTIGCLLLAVLLAAGLAACGSSPASPSDAGDPPAAENSTPAVTEEVPPPESDASDSAETDPPATEEASSDAEISPEEETSQEEREEEPIMEENTFYVHVNGETFSAAFADTSGAQALKELLAGGDLTISMNDYGGFEKVGALGQSLPAENRQTSTEAGDIVLYQGNQIVIFYGSNAWSYTRLGKVDDLTGWAEALGSGAVSVTFSLQG